MLCCIAVWNNTVSACYEIDDIQWSLLFVTRYIVSWAQAHLFVLPFLGLFPCEYVSSIVLSCYPLNVRRRHCQQAGNLKVWQNLVHFVFDFSADFSLCWLWECGNLTTNFWCGDMFRIITIHFYFKNSYYSVLWYFNGKESTTVS